MNNDVWNEAKGRIATDYGLSPTTDWNASVGGTTYGALVSSEYHGKVNYYANQNIQIANTAEEAKHIYNQRVLASAKAGAWDYVSAGAEGFAEGARGGGSIVANTFTWGGTDALGWTDSKQYQGSAYTVSRIAATVSREAFITAGTLGSSQAFRAGGSLGYGVLAGIGEGYSTVQNARSVVEGVENVEAGNNWGYLQIAAGAVGLKGNLSAGQELASGGLHIYRGVRLNQITNDISSQVDSAIAAGDVSALRDLGGSLKEARGAIAGGDRFRGTIIDVAVKNQAAETFGLKSLTYTERFKYGPDIYNPNTMRGWDITTPKQWDAHVSKYVTNPAPGRPQWNTLEPLLTK
jgi:hypothetical protein